MDELKLRKPQREQWLQDARDDFDLAFEAEHDMREEMIDDLRFSWGDQWDEQIKSEREREKRPCMTFDRIGDIMRKAMKGVRANKPSIKTVPGEEGDKDTAEVYTDLIREIEYSSGSSMPYLWAAEMAMRCGYGVFKVCQVENDGDVWNQDLRLKRVANPFTVYLDPDSAHPTKADGRFAFETANYRKKRFHQKWPKADAEPFGEGTVGERHEKWYSDSTIRVATYWKKVPKKRTILLLSDGRTVYADELTESDASLNVIREREVDSHILYKLTITGNQILEGPIKWPGNIIPLIPVYGEEMNIEGKVSYRGLVRTAKDSQRMYNYARTTTAEILSQQPKTPWLVGASQMTKELQPYWAKANSATLPYLPFDDSKNPTPPQRQPPPVSPTGFVQEAVQAADDIQRSTGFFDASLGAPSNESSGRAILARQVGGDEGVMVFGDNLGASMEHAGRVLVELIPSMYDTERVVRVRGEDDSEREVVINQPSLEFNQRTGEVETVVSNDLGRGRYDVRILVGRGYQTKRLEASDSMFAFLQAFPAAAPMVADLVAKNQDWPQAEEFAERLRNMVPPGLLDEDDPEKQQAQQQQMQIQMQQLMLAMQQQQADIEKTKSETVENMADARKKVADAEATQGRQLTA